MKPSRILCALIGCAGVASAVDSPFIGPRAVAMGGAAAASAHDVEAQYLNPAAFGFFGKTPQNEAAEIEVTTAEATASGSAAAIETDAPVAETRKYYRNDNNHLGRQTFGLQGDVTAGGRIIGSFGSSHAVLADANAGVGVRVGNIGVGFRVWGQAAAYHNTKDQDFIDAMSALDSINTQNLLSDPSAAMALLTGGNTQSYAQVARGASREMTLLTNAVTIAEVPITYGYAFTDWISAGATVRIMRGEVYGGRFFGYPDYDDAIAGISDYFALGASDIDYGSEVLDYSEETMQVGVDVGVMARIPMFNFSLTGKNLTKPTFKGYKGLGFTPIFVRQDPNLTELFYGGGAFNPLALFGPPNFQLGGLAPNRFPGENVVLDPSANVSAAFIPWPWLTIEATADLNPVSTLFEGYKQQNVGLGLELDAARTFSLRLGVSQNIAGTASSPVVSAGLGLDIFGVHADLAGAAATENTTVAGEKVPVEARASLALGFDW